MQNTGTLVILSAFSGLLGALLTQLMTGLFSYVNDRRKQQFELQKQYRGKRAEIGESFYFMHGELMSMIKKNIAYWKNRQDYRSEVTLQFLKLEIDRLDGYQSRLQTENWKYNLVGIYYHIPYDFADMLDDNKTSHELYLKVLDLSEVIRRTLPQEREDIYGNYLVVLNELIQHYEKVYLRMTENMEAVKTQLLQDFKSN
ncbi:hypothetical protein SNE25_20080 [Mucilaginibacter sabulilitoris]|uniref:DUF4760 domain-containing protein n=1 Tax=Mucilaginibacter sabulilitoris TaxID=1173583 RepID=A0ABZ0TEJ9_9SPHI|nr:hypothetical protein [Mucilaginibacter sabulilitoris]WPU91619.1 hypothetical protein SNE25_20080 [Mucilaginibacter sabulilitoris]